MGRRRLRAAGAGSRRPGAQGLRRHVRLLSGTTSGRATGAGAPAPAAHPRPPGGEKLAGAADRYRVRQWAYRIVYEVRDLELVVVLVKVVHRSQVYKSR